MNGVLVAGFTGFILVENGWGGKCERGREAGAKRNTEGSEGEWRRWGSAARWAENAGRRPAVRKTGLALGERGGGDDAGAFFYGDDLIGGDILKLIGLAAGPADFDGVGFGVITETEGED